MPLAATFRHRSVELMGNPDGHGLKGRDEERGKELDRAGGDEDMAMLIIRRKARALRCYVYALWAKHRLHLPVCKVRPHLFMPLPKCSLN